jgi:hypothetical protein
MEQAELFKFLGIFLLSTVKLLFAPGAAVAAGFNMPETIIITSTGGCSGILFFYYFGHWLTEYLRRIVQKQRKVTVANGAQFSKAPTFNKRNRIIVKVKYHFGMMGIVLFTPVLLSIPIGAVVAARLYWGSRWALPLLILSTVAWSVILTLLSTTLKYKLSL